MKKWKSQIAIIIQGKCMSRKLNSLTDSHSNCSILKSEFQFLIFFMKSRLVSSLSTNLNIMNYIEILKDKCIPSWNFQKYLYFYCFLKWNCEQKSHNEVPQEWLPKCLIYDQSFTHFVGKYCWQITRKRISVLSSSYSPAHEFIIVLHKNIQI